MGRDLQRWKAEEKASRGRVGRRASVSRYGCVSRNHSRRRGASISNTWLILSILRQQLRPTWTRLRRRLISKMKQQITVSQASATPNMADTPAASSEPRTPPSSASEQARIRKERREAKIRAGGSARLDKITGLGGGIPRGIAAPVAMKAVCMELNPFFRPPAAARDRPGPWRPRRGGHITTFLRTQQGWTCQHQRPTATNQR